MIWISFPENPLIKGVKENICLPFDVYLMYLNPTLCKSNLTCAIPTNMITLLLLQVVQKISPETKCIANSNDKTALSSINDVSLSMYNGQRLYIEIDQGKTLVIYLSHR